MSPKEEVYQFIKIVLGCTFIIYFLKWSKEVVELLAK